MVFDFSLDSEAILIIVGLSISFFTGLVYELKLYYYKKLIKGKKQLIELTSRYIKVVISLHILSVTYFFMRLVQVVIETNIPNYMAVDLVMILVFITLAFLAGDILLMIKDFGGIEDEYRWV